IRPVRIMGSIGPMARDLDDLELALSIIAGPGAGGIVPPVPLGERTRRELTGLRLAVAPTVPGAEVAGALRGEVEGVAAAASGAGAAVEERLPDFDWAAMNELFVALLTTVTSVMEQAAELPDERRTLAWYLTALHRRDAFIEAWESFFGGVDA